jgi:hypothetical protein
MKLTNFSVTVSFLLYKLIVAVAIMSYTSGAAFGFSINPLIKNADMGMVLVPVLVVPFLLFGGFFVSTDNIPVWLF